MSNGHNPGLELGYADTDLSILISFSQKKSVRGRILFIAAASRSAQKLRVTVHKADGTIESLENTLALWVNMQTLILVFLLHITYVSDLSVEWVFQSRDHEADG